MDEETLQKVTDAYVESIEILSSIAKDDKADFKQRIDAVRGIHAAYDNNHLLDKIHDIVTTQSEGASKVIDQVKRLKPRRPEWMGEDEGEE